MNDATPAPEDGRSRADATTDGSSIHLRRRGVEHGSFTPPPRDPPTDAREQWLQGEPLFLPLAVAGYLEPARDLLTSTRRMFERLRDGQRFLDELSGRMTDPTFRPAGCTFDREDEREIEKVFAHAGVTEADTVARDLWAKLSWIANDESDLSLRIRFSCGHERLHDWVDDAERAIWADRFAEEVFPECAILSQNEDLLDAASALCERPIRLSERIIYSNAPGGGAVFHHDADPGQLGVVFAQYAGRTAWLALPAQQLAEEVARAAHDCGDALQSADIDTFRDVDSVLKAMEATPLPKALWQLLNREPSFTERLVDRGALYVVEPGDVLLLPTHGFANTTWHSVFALGKRASLAHSFGIFPHDVESESDAPGSQHLGADTAGGATR